MLLVFDGQLSWARNDGGTCLVIPDSIALTGAALSSNTSNIPSSKGGTDQTGFGLQLYVWLAMFSFLALPNPRLLGLTFIGLAIVGMIGLLISPSDCGRWRQAVEADLWVTLVVPVLVYLLYVTVERTEDHDLVSDAAVTRETDSAVTREPGVGKRTDRTVELDL